MTRTPGDTPWGWGAPPQVPAGSVAIECTANGFNEFQSFWSNLKIGEREVPSMWQKVFLAWFLKPEYELPLGLERDFHDEYEEWLFNYIKNDKTLKQIDKQYPTAPGDEPAHEASTEIKVEYLGYPFATYGHIYGGYDALDLTSSSVVAWSP